MKKKEEKYTEEELKKAHDDNGYCGSCSWHGAFYEMEYERTNNPKYPNEYHAECIGEDEYSGRHRGCYIYPEKTK